MMNPQTQLEIIQEHTVSSSGKGVPTLTHQKTKEISYDSDEKSMEKMKMYQNSSKNLFEDQMEASNVYLAIFSDEIFATHGIEEEDFNAAMNHY